MSRECCNRGLFNYELVNNSEGELEIGRKCILCGGWNFRVVENSDLAAIWEAIENPNVVSCVRCEEWVDLCCMVERKEGLVCDECADKVD